MVQESSHSSQSVSQVSLTAFGQKVVRLESLHASVDSSSGAGHDDDDDGSDAGGGDDDDNDDCDDDLLTLTHFLST